ncbi:MAG: TlpA disulfide reductase family protein [Balneola sp.]|jgi:peroxiredoxin
MEKIVLLIIVVLALSGQIIAQKSPEPDSLYQEIIQKFKLEFEKIDHANRSLTDSVGALRALEFEELYNKYPESESGKKGLVVAFKGWLNVDSLDIMGVYINNISPDSDLWGDLIPWYNFALMNSGAKPDKFYNYLKSILKTESVKNPNNLSYIYSELGSLEMIINSDTLETRKYFEKVIEINTDSFEVEAAKRDLYDLNKLQIGNQLPGFRAKDIAGNVIDTRDFEGKYILIEFWATWCGPCIPEIPYLKKAYDDFGDREDFKIIGVSLDTDRVKLKEFLEENEIKWTQIIDEGGAGKWSGKLGTLFAVGNGIPKTFLIDKEGKIIAKELRKERLNEILSQHLD